MYRRVTRRVKSDQEVIDDMVEAYMGRLTPRDVEMELIDALYQRFEGMDEAAFEEQRLDLDVSRTTDPAAEEDWDDREDR